MDKDLQDLAAQAGIRLLPSGTYYLFASGEYYLYDAKANDLFLGIARNAAVARAFIQGYAAAREERG
jgi:hypothetical protein